MYHKRTFEEYIEMLEQRWGKTDGSYPTVRIEHGNPYYKCKFCGRSDPEISSHGHYKGCRWVQMYRSIQGLRRILVV
jgi:hypothetical protein